MHEPPWEEAGWAALSAFAVLVGENGRVLDTRGSVDDLAETSGPWTGRLVADLLPPAARADFDVAVGMARHTGRATFRVDPAGAGPACGWVLSLTRLDAVGGRLVVAGRRAAVDRSAALHEAFVKASSEIVWHKDVAAGRIERRGWCQFTGQSDQPDDAWSWLDVIHPDDRDRVQAAAVAADLSGTPLSVEYRLRHCSGEWRWVADDAVPVVQDGAVTDWVGIVADIHARRIAEDQIRASEFSLRLAVEATGLGTWDVDVRTDDRCWSDELKAMLGLPPSARESAELLMECVHPEDRASVAAFNAAFSGSPTTLNSVVFRVIRRDDGRVTWIRSQGRLVFDPAGQPIRRIGTFQDITEQQETRDALKLALRRQEALIAATSEIVWQASADQSSGDGTGWTEFTGQSMDDADGDGWLRSVHPDDRARAKSICEDAVARGTPYTNEYRLWHLSGEWRWVVDRVVPLRDDAGAVTEWVGIISDVHNRKTAEDRIRRAALTDPLTGLANRTSFQARLDGLLGGETTAPGATALLLVDLDRFKEVNDSLGHEAGDEALRVLAARLTDAAPAGATVARLGGDEFGVLAAVTCEEDAQAIAAGILARVNRPFRYGARDLDCSATIGYAVHPLHDADRQALLKNADMALYAAKSAGRGCAMPFARSLRAEFDRRLNVLRMAKDALAENRIVPFYQPKISLRDGRLVGFEALLRWWDGATLQSPAALREAFQDGELAARIGGRMLDRVCADMAVWRSAGVQFGTVAINLSAPEFHRPDIAAEMLARVGAAGLPPDCLEVEVTETVLIENGTESVARVLDTLHRAGVAIALDDFGTGYASLTHLKRFPVSWIKIDRSFVSSLEADTGSAAIVHAVLGLAQNLGIRVVAEGVETAYQRAFLTRHGCDVMQGFLVSKPMAASRVPQFIRAHEAGLAWPDRAAG